MIIIKGRKHASKKGKKQKDDKQKHKERDKKRQAPKASCSYCLE